MRERERKREGETGHSHGHEQKQRKNNIKMALNVVACGHLRLPVGNEYGREAGKVILKRETRAGGERA